MYKVTVQPCFLTPGNLQNKSESSEMKTGSKTNNPIFRQGKGNRTNVPYNNSSLELKNARTLNPTLTGFKAHTLSAPKL